MVEQFFLRVARRMKIPAFRKAFLKIYFRQHGLYLQDHNSFSKDSFFMYRIDNVFLPSEFFDIPVTFDALLKKGRNESLFFYEPQKGDVIIDIGAGLGEESLLYSHLSGDKGRVFAIEANPAVFEVLEKTISWNNLNGVKAFNLAISDKEGTVCLDDKMSSFQNGFIRHGDPMQGGYNIPATRMDHFIDGQQLDRIDFLKANIEGAERFVIGTLTPQHFKKIRHIAIACHDFRYRNEGNEFFKTKEYVTHILQENGFEIHTRQTGIDYLDDWIYGTNKN